MLDILKGGGGCHLVDPITPYDIHIIHPKENIDAILIELFLKILALIFIIINDF